MSHEIERPDTTMDQAEAALARAKLRLCHDDSERGGNSALASALGITPQAVSQWRRVPAERVLEVERVTGVSRHELRADMYPLPDVPEESAA